MWLVISTQWKDWVCPFSLHQWLGKVLSLISVRASWPAGVVRECRLFCEAWISVNLPNSCSTKAQLWFTSDGGGGSEQWGCQNIGTSLHSFSDCSCLWRRELWETLLLLLQGGKMRSVLRSKSPWVERKLAAISAGWICAGNERCSS